MAYNLKQHDNDVDDVASILIRCMPAKVICSYLWKKCLFIILTYTRYNMFKPSCKVLYACSFMSSVFIVTNKGLL